MTSFTQKRDADFIRRCQTILNAEHARGIKPSVRRLVTLAIYGPADSYYISFDTARQKVYDYLANHPGPFTPELISEKPTQKRIRHLAESVRRLRNKHGADLPVSQALTMILNSGAPRFYITVKTGAKIFHRHFSRNLYYQIRHRPLKQ